MPLEIRDSEFYVPFYNKAVVHKLREEFKKREFIDIYLKGGRYSGKSYAIANMILELSYRDCRRSTIVVAMELKDHYERGVILFDNIMAELGINREWRWKSKTTRPKLIRSVNGYTQEIRFVAVADLETAGFEPPVNEATGKAGYIGTIWGDEMSKKEDNSPGSDFQMVRRFLDAVRTAKNTIIRHMRDDEDNGAIVTFMSLNPWGGENPIMRDFHDLLSDDYEKLVKEGYNLAYEDDEETFKICATTNYRVNSKLDRKTRRSIRSNRKDPRAATIIDGITGKTLNADFGRELILMEGLNKSGNVPKDSEFLPMNMSMDVGNISAIYCNGYDMRYMVKASGKYFPTRIITKGEYTSDVKTDPRDIPSRYKDILRHIHAMANRFPTMRQGKFPLYIDGSATETIELLKTYAIELQNENGMYDFSFLQILRQSDKWKKAWGRDKRRNRFTDMVGTYSWIVDYKECPKFYSETGKIVDKRTEDLFDHWYDAVMYGIMPLYDELQTGITLRAIQKKQTIIEM